MITGYGANQGYVAVTAADEKCGVIVGAEAHGMGQEQSTLIPAIEDIEMNLGMDLSESDCVITADTGYSSEANMKYLFERNIDAVVPDNQFRKRDPKFAESETYVSFHPNGATCFRVNGATQTTVFPLLQKL